ncbi:MAG TPA: GNAT family N-acetyltransferase [Acidobacteriaceae bacterium]|nr:GNAT family N-acetyltransferase [Acidobacteriaceae bacterium]
MATGSSSSRQFNIRRATRGDLQQLTALLERYYTEWNVVQRDAPERTLEYIDQPDPFGFTIAEQDGVLAACVLLRNLPSIPSAAECKRLYVLPDYRGAGLASRLMDFVERAAMSKVDWIYLDTGANFTAAQSLYHARGYETCERYNDNPQATRFFHKRLPG